MLGRHDLPLLMLLGFCVSWSTGSATHAQEPHSNPPLPQKKFPMPDGGMEAFPKPYPRPASQWQSLEKARYQKLLAAGQFDVIVVPFQIQDRAYSRSINALMTAQLALALSQSGKLRVPDQYLVSRALGDGQRRVDPEGAYRLAAATGAKRIVWGYVGHGGNRRVTLTLQWQDKPADGPIDASTELKIRTFDSVYYEAEDAPQDVFEKLLPDVLHTLGVERKLATAETAVPALPPAAPETPRQIYSSLSSNALRDAYHFQLLATLTPSLFSGRARERFVEKSLLALHGLPSDSREVRYLRARGLMQMGLRVPALAVLRKPANDEEKALHALLNGNLPEVLESTARISHPVKRFLATIDALNIAWAYDAFDPDSPAIKSGLSMLRGSEWKVLVDRASRDQDMWYQFENLDWKRLLDKAFPVNGYTADTMMNAAVVVGDASRIQTISDFSVREHALKLQEQHPEKWCCAPMSAHPSELDYLDLIEETANSNLARRIYFQYQIQGNPERALNLLAGMTSVYRDNPHFTLLRAQSEFALAGKSESSIRQGLLKAAYADAYDACYWEQGQTRDSRDALQIILSLGHSGRSDYGYPGDIYGSDLPRQPYYTTESSYSIAQEINYLLNALENSTYEFWPVKRLYYILAIVKPDEAMLEFVFRALDGRFSGNGNLETLKASNALRNGNTVGAINGYREAIKLMPKRWESYQALMALLYSEGRVDEAASVAKSFPDFAPGASANAVGIANNAYAAGSLFYWSGFFSHALPFYEIAANLKTGAQSSIASDARLKMQKRDFLGALESSYYDAIRYHSSYAFRDYLGLLHIMGVSTDAWNAFDTLLGQSDKSHVWETALVGHRLARVSDGGLVTWAKQDAHRNAGSLSNDAAIYLVRAASVDRIPTETEIAAISEIDSPVWKVSIEEGAMTVRVSKNGQFRVIVGPTNGPNVNLSAREFQNAQKVAVKSDLVYFTEAYKALREKKYELANALMNEAASIYDLSKFQTGYMLPYAAFAALKSGNGENFETRLLGAKYIAFDKMLAQAVSTGMAGKTDESLDLLRLAVFRRPYTEGRPVFTEYEYGEIAEWLFEATGKSAYRDIAVDWAKKTQKTQPWHAWAYAIEAKLSTDQAARRDAIGIANYLDPDSERLKSVARSEINSVAKGFRNPFLTRDPGTEKTTLDSSTREISIVLQ